MKKSEVQEREYLEEIKNKIRKGIEGVDERLARYKKEIKDDTKYRGEAKDSMDGAEKIAFRQIIEHKVQIAKQVIEQKKRLEKTLEAPYFGRFDFKSSDKKEVNKIYVGINNFFANDENESLICDWRAPISSIFYEYEIGLAKYEAPSGVLEGDVLLKRQFRIREGEMDFMLESSLNITDDILQKVLSSSSDNAMKNIVATIQRNQNTIIRDEKTSALIIQGVAGSGKTSIALHRIAFLLYRFKETISSEDILIISPNEVFADYISNVLPELGEETVGEMQMEQIAKDLLGKECEFQTFFEQTSELLEKDDEELRKRIQFKSSPVFLKKIEEYAEHVKKNLFVADNVSVGACYVPDWVFEEVFQDNIDYSKSDCIKRMTEAIRGKIDMEYNYVLETEEKLELKKHITKMHQGSELLKTYKDMFVWLNEPSLLKFIDKSKLEYADVFPLLYLKICLGGKSIKIKKVKHLLIDEMQDYTPVQYVVIEKLFKCNKTILGDANQSVNPYTSSNAETIQNFFRASTYVELNKSFRSTYEIMQFVQKISPNPNLEVIERHGEVPQVLEFKNKQDEISKISEITTGLKKSKYNTIGIICKTQNQAEELYNELKKAGQDSCLLTSESSKFEAGIIICTAHMAKGLEFDQVIVPSATEENYNSLMDRNLLYVACTRALHSLVVTHVGKRTDLIVE